MKLLKQSLVLLGLNLAIAAQEAWAEDISVDGCLAADANTRDPALQDRVIRICTIALEKQDLSAEDRANLLKTRGVVLRNHGELETSLKDLTQAVELNSHDAGHLRMRAWTFREMGRLSEAEKDYDLALGLEPEWQGFLSRCVVRVGLERFVEALEDCERSLSLRRTGDGLFFSANALHRLEKSQEALPRIYEACQLADALPEHFLLMAEIQIEIGKLEEARNTAVQARSRFPSDTRLQTLLIDLGL